MCPTHTRWRLDASSLSFELQRPIPRCGSPTLWMVVIVMQLSNFFRKLQRNLQLVYTWPHMFHSFALYGDAKLGPHEVNALSRSFVNKDDFVKRSERIPTEQLNFRPLKRRGSVYEKPAMQIVNQVTPACNRTLMMLVVIRSWLTHIPSLRLLMLHGEKCTSTSFWPLPILFWARKTESSNHPKLKSFYISCRMRTD